MSTLLVIKGHPLTSESSFSLKGLDTFLEAYKAQHPNDHIDLLDVFNADIPELDQDMAEAFAALAKGSELSDLSSQQQDKLTRYASYTDQFLAADKVVIASPLWNLMIPASLKKWIDAISVAGKTFRYTPQGPEGLSGKKPVLHIQANGGVYGQEDPASVYLKTLFQFIDADYQQITMEGHAYEPDKTPELQANFFTQLKRAATDF